MPLAFFFVAMITLLGGWYQMENHAHQAQLIRHSEAQAVAANIASYHMTVMRCARYEDPATPGSRPHWGTFTAFNGDARDFISLCEAAGVHGPDWLRGLFPGVNMTIAASRVTVTYDPVQGLHASRAGVQAQLNEMTDNGIILGVPIEGF